MIKVNKKLVVSSSPHIRSIESIQSIMGDVLIALLPAVIMAVFLFGYRALLTIIIAMGSAMLAEAIWLKKKDIFSDGSAAVTGLLLALTLPPAPPWWLVVVGSVAAIIIGKQVFGGIGYNIFNPALVGRAIIVVSWGSHMAGNIWSPPQLFNFSADVSAVTTATVLALPQEALAHSLGQLFIGNMAGCLGETSALALLLGGLWLYFKGHIDIRIPVCYLGMVFTLGVLFGGGTYHSPLFTGLFHLFSGGVMLGAIYMATDMVTTPVTPRGKVIFGIGCGLITMMIRFWGSLPEGVTFAILIMNAVTPIIDNYTTPQPFGRMSNSA